MTFNTPTLWCPLKNPRQMAALVQPCGASGGCVLWHGRNVPFRSLNPMISRRESGDITPLRKAHVSHMRELTLDFINSISPTS